jgi:16S rRNA (cytosine1402-N4)-methyltransferase
MRSILLEMTSHVPVLAGELIELLDPQPGQVAVDGTFGAGGHARLVAGRLGPEGTLVAIDRDPEAEERYAAFAAEVPCRTRFIRASFVDGLAELAAEGLRADLVYLDLGMSSMQVDTLERGFSYVYDAPLDMRMDTSQALTAGRSSTRGTSGNSSGPCATMARSATPPRSHGPSCARGRAGSSRRPTSSSTSSSTPSPRPHASPGPSRQADVPGDPHRRQRRARPDRRGAAARLEPAAPGRPLRRDVVPLPRGPARQALPRRPRARLHLPADLPVCACGREPLAELITRRSVVPTPGEVAANPRSASARLRVARKLLEDPDA